MNRKINKFPKETIDRICAGEVIDSPSAVIKELVENSIDATSSNIIIEIKNGGKESICVIDNGSGISKEDLEIALSKHTSSKIYEFKDLLDLDTLGFRGEALSSIVSVSDFEIISKTQESKTGFSIKASFGNIGKVEPKSINTGTKIYVGNLYEKIPARQKFLGSELSEFRKILKILYPLVLSHPEISFTILNNDKEYLKLDRQTPKERFIKLHNIEQETFYEIETQDAKYKIQGFLSYPDKSPNPPKFYIYVNNRFINSNSIIYSAIKQSYHRLHADNHMPSGIIYLTVPKDEIDVNIHPKKMDIAFEYPQKIFEFIYRSISANLEKEFLKIKPNTNFEINKEENFISFPNELRKQNFHKSNDQINPILFEDFEKIDSSKTNDIIALTQIFNCFIVAKSKSEIIFFDQHTIHERILYEKFENTLSKNLSESQNLITPEIITLDNKFAIELEELLSFLRDLGFDIEKYGQNSFSIRSIPNILKDINIKEYIENILIDFREYNLVGEKTPKKLSEIFEKRIAYMACRGAIKAGKVLSLYEQQDLINQIGSLKKGYTCPHGRPLKVELSLLDFEKMFHRK